MMNGFEKITDLIPIRTLQRVANDFDEMMNYHIRIIDATTNKIIIQSDNTGKDLLCMMLLNGEKCKKPCEEISNFAKKKLITDNKTYIYKCCFELVNFLAPITVNGKIIAFLSGGPIRISNPDLKQSEKNAAEINISIDQYLEAYLNIPLFNHEVIETMGKFLKTTLNSMASTAFSNTTEKIKIEKMSDLTRGLEKEILEKGRKLETIEVLYRNLVENAPDIIYSVNKDDNFIAINKSVEDILGYTKRELLGESFFKIVYEGDKEKVYQAYLDALNGKRKLVGFGFKAKTKKGEIKYLELNSQRSFNKYGELEKAEGVIRDVTESHILAENLKFSENKFRAIVENAQDIIYTVDRTGIITSINAIVEKITNYSPDEIIGNNFAKFLHPDDREKLVNSFNDILNKKKKGTSGFQFRIIGKEGQIILVELNSLGIFDKNGDFLMIEGILRDISKESILKRELLKANDRFKSLFDSISEAAYIADGEGKLLLVNNVMLNLFGYQKRTEMVGHHATEFYVNPSDRSLLEKNLKEKGYAKNFVAYLKKRDGNTFYAKIDSGIITNEHGEMIGVQGVVKDVTRVVILEKEVERLKKLERQRRQGINVQDCKLKTSELRNEKRGNE